MVEIPAETLHEPLEPATQPKRFGAGLSEAEVRRFQSILRDECGVDVPLSEAWSRAMELLSLVEMLLQSRGVFEPNGTYPQSSHSLAIDRFSVLRNR